MRGVFAIVSLWSLSLLAHDHAGNGPGPRAAIAAAASVKPGPAQASVLNPATVEATTGGKPEIAGDVVKVSFPREDVKVEVDGWPLPPFMGLTSWAAFTPMRQHGIEAMVMGDLVLFEDEVHAAMTTALEAGLEITALHNHFFFDHPRVFFMHIHGEGRLADLGTSRIHRRTLRRWEDRV